MPRGVILILLLVGAFAATSAAEQRGQIEIRGKKLPLHLYGDRAGAPVVVSSGDGGWVHLAPEIAETLERGGFYVIGFDAKAYLSAFTDGHRSLSTEDVGADFRVLLDYALRPEQPRPILIGVSEGAGLSVLAATREENKKLLDGVIGLGLPDVTELAWRWRDAIIYLTKKLPNEPFFHVGDIIAEVAPLPLVAIHATRDEFVSLSQVQTLMQLAREPKKLWIIEASDHRFSGSEVELAQRLIEAIQWVRDHRNRASR